MRFTTAILTALLLTVSTTFALEPDVLLIDDAGAQQLEAFYGTACLEAQRSYHAWTVSQAGAVPASTLDAYATVVWVAGNGSTAKSIEGGAETLLSYVEKGGRFILVGDRIGSSLAPVLARVFGLEIKHFNTVVNEMNGRLADVISDGRKLKLATAGAETANYRKPAPGEPTVHPEIVYWTPDRGVSRLTAARIETLGPKPHRAAWFGFGLTRAADAARARAVFTRCIQWVTPEPAAASPQGKHRQMWRD